MVVGMRTTPITTKTYFFSPTAEQLQFLKKTYAKVNESRCFFLVTLMLSCVDGYLYVKNWPLYKPALS